MTHEKMPEALLFASDRPTSLNDDLYQWSIDAEQLIQDQHAEIERLRAEVEGLRKDAVLIDWLGSAPTGVIRMDFNPFNPTYINYSASGGDIRPALTKAMQSTKEQQ